MVLLLVPGILLLRRGALRGLLGYLDGSAVLFSWDVALSLLCIPGAFLRLIFLLLEMHAVLLLLVCSRIQCASLLRSMLV